MSSWQTKRATEGSYVRQNRFSYTYAGYAKGGATSVALYEYQTHGFIGDKKSILAQAVYEKSLARQGILK